MIEAWEAVLFVIVSATMILIACYSLTFFAFMWGALLQHIDKQIAKEVMRYYQEVMGDYLSEIEKREGEIKMLDEDIKYRREVRRVMKQYARGMLWKK